MFVGESWQSVVSRLGHVLRFNAHTAHVAAALEHVAIHDDDCGHVDGDHSSVLMAHSKHTQRLRPVCVCDGVGVSRVKSDDLVPFLSNTDVMTCCPVRLYHGFG